MPDKDHDLRFSRHLRLPQIGPAGQEKLRQSTVLIVGLGGLGSPAAMYLSAAGVGRLLLVDFDMVEISNMQRQIIHQTRSIGESKVSSASEMLIAANPDIAIETFPYQLEERDYQELLVRVDLVLDCTDNFPSRFELNRHVYAAKKPLINAAAVRWEGQLSTFDFRKTDSPCYQCLYPDPEILAGSCEQEGVVAALVGVIGSMQGLEAIRLLLDCGRGMTGRLLLFDGLHMDWQEITLPKNPHCPVCS